MSQFDGDTTTIPGGPSPLHSEMERLHNESIELHKVAKLPRVRMCCHVAALMQCCVWMCVVGLTRICQNTGAVDIAPGDFCLALCPSWMYHFYCGEDIPSCRKHFKCAKDAECVNNTPCHHTPLEATKRTFAEITMRLDCIRKLLIKHVGNTAKFVWGQPP